MLTATGLVKAFRGPDGRPVRAVDGLDLVAPGGEVTGLLGPNGAGKTTTLRLLATLLRPDAGRVVVAGADTQADPVGARAQLAYVPAEAGLPERITPLETVTAFARIQGVPDARQRARALLERLGAEAYVHRACGDLSTGMKRRVVLARALVHDPPVLLLDEPTDGLDVAGRREVLGLLRDLAAEGRAVLLSSHIMGEVEAICDRLTVVAGGKAVAAGTLAEVQALATSGRLDDAFMALVGGPP